MARSVPANPETEAFRLADSPSHLLHRVEQLAADRFSRLVDESVTLRQFTVLAAIAESPGLSQSDLVRATGVDRSTMADMMGRMERNGWIVRSPSTIDGRAQSVRLAASGATILAAATPHARASDAAILDELARTKKRSFLNLLTKILKKADETAEREDREARKKAKKEGKKEKEGKKDKTAAEKNEPKRDAKAKTRR